MSSGIWNYIGERRGGCASSTFRALYVLLVVILLAGCGPQRVARQDVVQEDAGNGGDVVSIESIGVVGEGNSILIEASDKIKYTAFRLAGPPRLLIDMPGITIEKVDRPILVDNDYITEITTSIYGEGERKIGRIEVGLNSGIEYDIKIGDDSLMIALRKNIYVSGVTEPDEVELEGYGEDIEVLEGVVTEELAEETVETIPVTSGPGDRITGIETAGREGELVVSIVENGPPSSYNAFGLDSPARLVIDIWGVKNTLHERSIDVDDAFVKRVRIGDHPDKSRIVIDFSGDVVPSHSIDKVDNTLMVRFGETGEEVASDLVQEVAAEVVVASVTPAEVEATFVPESIAPVVVVPEMPEAIIPDISEGAGSPSMQVAVAEVAPKPERTIIQVESVDFNKVEGKARLKIVTSESVRYKVSKTTDGAVIALDLEGTAISNDLSRILDASDLKTPVASVSSFQVSEAPDSIVRVLVQLQEPSLYGLSQSGNAIYVDFPLPSVEERQVARSGAVPQAEEAGGGKGRYSGRKISLDLTDADIANVLRLIAEVSNLNIISGDDVKGKISLRLIDVPWDQAFDIILRTKGLGKVEEGNVVMVAPLGKIRQEKEASLAALKASERLDPLELKMIPVNYATAAELESQVKSLLSDRGTISTEGRTNTLIIRDTEAVLEEVMRIVKKLDTPTPQVLIETRIVEAQSTFVRDLGVQWGAAHGTIGTDRYTTTFGSTATPPPNTLFPSGFIGTGGTFEEQPNFAVNLPASGTVGALGGLGFAFGKLSGDALLVDLRLTAGEQSGMTKTISRPRIATLDNKEAKIAQGERIPFETTSSTGTQTEFIDAELELAVTPHITPDGSVSMLIIATRNSIGSFRSSSGAPSINTKEVSTEILIKDGETAVIGGIVISDNSDTDSGIPFLNKIPILGWLFKSQSLSNNQTELLIFITPTILKKDK
ncbi:MAG: type IV pilus secretin PilQ [Deltaproteobacteria bacterium]|nr:type IV pilus secretin PilQ [Deltaproteobacteria bacterium]